MSIRRETMRFAVFVPVAAERLREHLTSVDSEILPAPTGVKQAILHV